MNRLIDTMTGAEVRGRLSPFFDGTCCYEDLDGWLTDELENLFAEEPHWSDNLDAEDNQTWVLCFVSNASESCTWHTCWIYKVNSDGSYGPSNYEKGFLYATPVDLNLRYNSGEDTL